MYKSVLSLFFYLFLTLATGVFLTGCSGNSSDSATTQTQTSASSPFYDPPLRLLGELNNGGGTAKRVASEGEGGGLCSWLIKMVVEGLEEGITHGIGDATTGKLFEGLNNNSGTSAQFAAISNQLTNITNQVNLLIQQNNTIINLINVATLAEINTTLQTAVNAAAVDIKTAWGPGSASYTSIATNAANKTMSNANLDALVDLFLVGQKNSNQGLKESSNVLKGLILPDFGNGLLTSFASQLVANATTSPTALSNPQTVAAAAKQGITPAAYLAEQSYILLQQKFGQILTYQLEALIMIIEIDYINDKDGSLLLAKTDMDDFKATIQAECANFETAVNFLMINSVDYRTAANYAAESGLMHKYGLASDKTYRDIFATSRVLVAQLNGSFQKDFGLHAAIVIPYLYRYPASGTGPVSPGPITVKFKSYSSSQLGFANYSSTITVNQPAQSAGQFPYTAWHPATATASAQSFPDNSWLLYEFSAANDFPAGKYHLILVDGGDKTAPWNHTETLYGNLTVRWYNPNISVSATANGTFSQTPTNVFKFGMFSGRWNWGYNMISMSPWIAPSTTKNGFNNTPNPYNGTFPGAPSPPPASKYLNSNVFTPAPLNFGMLINPFPSYEQDEYSYTMNFPFTVSMDSAPTNNLTRAGTGVNIYYNNSVNIVAYQFKVDYSYVFNDTAAKTSDTITSFMDESFSKPFLYSANHPATNSGIMLPSKVNIKENENYNITVAAELNSNYACLVGGCGERSGNIKLSSDMQVVYTGTYQLSF